MIVTSSSYYFNGIKLATFTISNASSSLKYNITVSSPSPIIIPYLKELKYNDTIIENDYNRQTHTRSVNVSNVTYNVYDV